MTMHKNYKCPECGFPVAHGSMWDPDSYLETGIDEEPDVCYSCGWKYDKTKDTLNNLGCFALILIFGFLYITFLFSW